MLKMFNLSHLPTVPATEEEDLAGDVDEPPDDQLSPLQTSFRHKDTMYLKSPTVPPTDRRESLLTRALMGESSPEDHSPTSNSSRPPPPRGMSTTSTHSNASMASTADLTSDTGTTSPASSATPSPPLPPTQYAHPLPSAIGTPAHSKLLVAPVSTGGELPVGDTNEATVEKTLGRKRCIMFACGGNGPAEKPKTPVPELRKEEAPLAEPPKRKCMLKFVCPSRDNQSNDLLGEALEDRSERTQKERRRSPTPTPRKSSTDSVVSTKNDETRTVKASISKEAFLTSPVSPTGGEQEQSESSPFHEFGSSIDEPDAWMTRPTNYKRKLTLTDCMKKENAIRQIGKEAEEEAEQEEQEEEELDEEVDDHDREDDFAPSDGSSDAGNESDDEGGFAESDGESDGGSDYEFWAPSKAHSTATAVTSNENIPIAHFRPSNLQHRSIASSIDSGAGGSISRQSSVQAFKYPSKRRTAKTMRMRPSTPELPDSTDFVCGTLDEDRPLEAAYISCREQRKREKHVPVPQDIDPSFPTTDPEDNDENENEACNNEEDDQLWVKDQLDGFDDETLRGRRKTSDTRKSPLQSPKRVHSPPPKVQIQRPLLSRHNTNRSPPPKHHAHRSPPPLKHAVYRSPAPRRLFGQSPTRLRSPPPQIRLRSPPGSPTGRPLPLGITITRLAQRPNLGRTASLPHTPNPFFRQYRSKSIQYSNGGSSGVTPTTLSEVPSRDRHVRGAVDIVIGLEKKRQKRREKFWRQHVRKAAKEQTDRKIAPGRGAERMRELGLECAERNKAYGLGQTAQLVISL